MTKQAEKHIERAMEYIAKGEEFYQRAADEIIAAQKADPTLGTREIGKRFGRSHTWVQDIVRWRTTGKSTRGGSEGAPTPYAEQQGAVAQRHARSVLRQAPPEQIAEMLSDPHVRAKVSQAQAIAYERVERKSEQAFRESVGEQVADDIAQETLLRDAELELFKARRSVINTLRKINEAGNEIPDAWREEFLRTVDDLDIKVNTLRDLLTGISIDDLDRLLTEEV